MKELGKRLLYFCLVAVMLVGTSASMVLAAGVSDNAAIDVSADTEEKADANAEEKIDENESSVTGYIVKEEASEDKLSAVYEEAVITEAEARQRILNLKNTYPENTPWDDNKTYTLSVLLNGATCRGEGCAAFAFQVSDLVFGTSAAAIEHTNFNSIRPGDILWIDNGSHCVVVIEVNGNTVTIVEGNYNSKVHWGRTLSLSSIKNGGAQSVISRYPETILAEPSGVCGDDVSYRISNGVLKIYGTGEMYDNGRYNGAPWYGLKDTIEHIEIGNGITKIGNNAFCDLKNVKSVEFGNAVTSIGKNAFSNCESLTDLILPDRLEELLGSAFYGCKSLETVTIPNRVTTLESMIFAQCTSLREVTIPDSVTTINGTPFNGCSKLYGLYLPNSVKSIADAYQVFARMTVFCEDNAPIMQLYNSNAMKKIICPRSEWSGTLSNGVSYSFDLNTRTLTLSGSGKQADYDEFKGYRYVKSIVLQNFNAAELPMYIKNMDSLENFTIPDCVTQINNGDFYGCESLQWVYVPPTVTSIIMRYSTFKQNADGFFIKGASGSYAESFANQNGIPFEASSGGGSTPAPAPADMEAIHAFVSRMYTVALNRQAEPAGLNDWSNRLATQEIDGAGIAHGFICSQEFVSRNLNNSDFVDALYHTFFDREPDAGGKADWMNRLNNGVSRNEVLAGFVNSTEFANLCDRFHIARGTMQADGSSIYRAGVRNYVLRMYTKALNRNGETVGVEDWTNRINMGIMDAETVAKSFFGSEEFINRNLSDEAYVETLYQTFMDRPSDPAGKADWLNRLSQGTDRQTVLEGFSRSVEFQNIMKSFGL